MKTSKGELHALLHIISLYFANRKTLEKDDKVWIIISWHLAKLVKRLLTRLHNVQDLPSSHAMRLSLSPAAGISVLYLFHFIAWSGLKMDTYSEAVIIRFTTQIEKTLP